MEVELFNSFKSRLMSFVFDFASQLFIPGNGVRENKIQDGAWEWKSFAVNLRTKENLLFRRKLINPKSVLWDFMAPFSTGWTKAANYVFDNKICRLRRFRHFSHVMNGVCLHSISKSFLIPFSSLIYSAWPRDTHKDCTKRELSSTTSARPPTLAPSLADELGNCSDY